MYTKLGHLATVFVPIAPVIFFGWRVYVEVEEMTSLWWLSIPAAVLTAVGLEIIGILAGHNALGWWKQRNIPLVTLASLILIIYVTIGTVELWGTIGVVVFWIAPLVYVLVALEELLGEAKTAVNRDGSYARRIAEEDRQLALKRKAQDREFARQERLFEQEQKAKDRDLARQLKADKRRTVVAGGGDTSGSDWRTLTNAQKLRLLDLSPGEITNQYHVAPKTARRWLQRAEELSGKLSASVQSNGHVK